MKNVSILVLLLTAMLILCACQEMPDASVGLTSSGEQLSTLPSGWSAVPQSPTTKPNPSAPTLPENCDNGHTFPDEALNCAVCGLDYYSATLDFLLSEDGTFYSVVSIGDCRRTKIIVPEAYNGLPVEGIIFLNTINALRAEWPEASVTHVVLPDTIKSIGKHAFGRYNSLVSINIPDGIQRIERDTFADCESLVSLTLPESVTYIGAYAFAACTKLKDLHIPEGVTEFGEGAFSSCVALEELRIPEEMTEIPDALALNCFSLTKVTYGSNVTKIGSDAFKGCINLQTFTIGENVNYIGAEAFAGCKALLSIEIPESVTTIEFKAFAECEALSVIVIPDSVTSLGTYVFSGCKSLKSVVIPDSITKINNGTFRNCKSLEYVIIGKGVRVIDSNVFEGCDIIKAIYYRGTKAEWEQIQMKRTVASDGKVETFIKPNPQFDNITVCYYSETAPTEPGNYWHYVDGVPTPWKSEE